MNWRRSRPSLFALDPLPVQAWRCTSCTMAVEISPPRHARPAHQDEFEALQAELVRLSTLYQSKRGNALLAPLMWKFSLFRHAGPAQQDNCQVLQTESVCRFTLYCTSLGTCVRLLKGKKSVVLPQHTRRRASASVCKLSMHVLFDLQYQCCRAICQLQTWKACTKNRSHTIRLADFWSSG